MHLIKNATIMTMSGDEPFKGYLLIDPPLIRAVGAGEPPSEIYEASSGDVFDAAGAWMLPGLIDAHCHVGCLLYTSDAADE